MAQFTRRQNADEKKPDRCRAKIAAKEIYMTELLKCEHGPQLRPELRPFAAEVSAAIRCHDNVALREIIERSGLEWLDPPLPDRYKNDISCGLRKT